MLARYRIARGRRAPDDPLPSGTRQDTRKHTRHVLRPDAQEVLHYLESTGEHAWDAFAERYRVLLARRFAADREPFDALAELARTADVHLGCSCPTASNPEVRRCHTWLALEFMQETYPDLDVRFPR